MRCTRTFRNLAALGLLAIAGTTMAAGPLTKKSGPQPVVVAEWTRLSFDLGDAAAEKAYDDQQIYKKVLLQGAKVGADGTIYVSTARWGGPEVPATLSKLVRRNGAWKLQPFPSKAMNDINNPRGLKAVLGFEIDRHGVMWILDQGHVAGAPSRPGDEKLIAWDLKNDQEVARYEFTDADSDKKCSFLNDVVIDNDNGFAYITDSGIFCDPLKGGLIVYDIHKNQAKRVLSAPEWVGDENFSFQIHGRDVLKPKDGRPNRMRTGADGIALSGDKQTLYWTNLTGNRLLKLPTAMLRDFYKTEDELRQAVKVDAILPSNTDGMTADRAGNLYLSALMLNGIMKRDSKTGAITPWVTHDEMSWVDTLSWGPGGSLYAVSNHLHLWVDGDMDFDRPAVPNFRIYKMDVGAKPYTSQ
ncbi:L-dopachrome tautomerase-related protein [Aquincola tertiaricarbonis]|uniref:L-dopachrome tautomerase-related protein n=1 Tax=Aquincola tertiaricarbonis TaxID=391953 RepID=UPI0006153A49|nr:L-dopachrome tautomerase-related protein [Aquincola tertiaricarbonis]